VSAFIKWRWKCGDEVVWGELDIVDILCVVIRDPGGKSERLDAT
jgi:hypothetical protein